MRDYIQVIPPKVKVITNLDTNQAHEKHSSHWLKGSKIKHVLASDGQNPDAKQD